MLTMSPRSNALLTPAHLRRYQALFIGRENDFALQREDGRYQRTGRVLTARELCAHLLGQQTIGTYVMNEKGLCRFAVFDADTRDGLAVLSKIQTQLACNGYPSFLETSRRGGHLWLFFDQPLPASQVRDWFQLPFCPAGVEFYPKQNEGSRYGSLIRLPFGVHRLTGKRYPFVRVHPGEAGTSTPLAATLLTMLTWLEQVETIPVSVERLQPLPCKRPFPEEQPQSLASTPLQLLPSSTNTIHAWCAMQNPFTVMSRYVDLDRRGLGCCPFGAHHSDGKDHHPSFKVYEPRRIGGSSWYCYTWGQGGNVFDFLCHWYNVDARSMWQRIQQGE